MKTLVFKSGASIEFVECYKRKEIVRNVQRDVLDFRFNVEGNSLDKLDKMFTEDECSKLTIINKGNKFTHENYSKRVSISKQEYNLSIVEVDKPCNVEQISIKIAQCTQDELEYSNLIKRMNTLLKEEKITIEQYNQIIKG